MSARRKCAFLDIILDLPEELRDQALQQLAQLGEGVAYDLETGPSSIAAAPAPAPSAKKLKKVDGVACGQKWRELIESEGRYITRLKTMRDRYKPGLLKLQLSTVDQYEVGTMFSNIGPLVTAHEQLLACLTSPDKDSLWAEKFLNILKFPLHTLHQNYLNSYSDGQKTYQKLSKEPNYNTFLASVKAETSREHGDALGLGDLLSEPYQRLPKYKLLIEELEQYTHPRDRNLPIFPLIVAQLARMVSFSTLEVDKRAAVMFALQQAISGFPDTLVSSERVYIDSIDVEDWPMDQATSDVKITARRTGSDPPQKCTLLLFNDIVVILKRDTKLFRRGADCIGLDKVSKLVDAYKASTLAISSPMKKKQPVKQELAFRGYVPLDLLSAADLGSEGFEIHMAAEPTGFSRNWVGRKRRHLTTMALSGVNLNGDKLRFMNNLWRMQAVNRISPASISSGVAVPIRKMQLATVLKAGQMSCGPEMALDMIFVNIWDKEPYLAERNLKLMSPLALVVGNSEASAALDFHTSKSPHLICALAQNRLIMRYRGSKKTVDQVNLFQAIARCAKEGLAAGYFNTPPNLPFTITKEDFTKSINRNRHHSVSVQRSGTVVSTSTFDSRRSANSSRHDREPSTLSSPPLSPISSPLKQPIASPRIAETSSPLRQSRAYRSEPDGEQKEILWSPSVTNHGTDRRLARTQSFEEVFHSMQAQSNLPQRPVSAMDYAYRPREEEDGDQTIVPSSPTRSKSPSGPRPYSPVPSPAQQPRSPLGPRPLSSLASEANRPDPRPLPSPIARPESSYAQKRRWDDGSGEDAARSKKPALISRKPTLEANNQSIRPSQQVKPRVPSGQRAREARRTSADSSRRRIPPARIAVPEIEVEESHIVVHERTGSRRQYVTGSFHSLHKLSGSDCEDADEDQAEELLAVREETRSIGSIRRSPVFIDLPQMKEPRTNSSDASTSGSSIRLASSASSQESASLALAEEHRTELEALRNENLQLRQQFEAANKQNVQLNQQLEDANTRTQIAENHAEVYKSQAEIAKMELGQAQNNLGTLSQQLEAAGTECISLRTHNDQLKQEVVNANAESQAALECFNDELLEIQDSVDGGEFGDVVKAWTAEKAAHHASKQAHRREVATSAELNRRLEQERYQRQTYEQLLVKHGLLRAAS